MTLVEALVASLLLAIGVMGMVKLWMFSFQVTISTDDRAIAYNLGRQAVEAVKNTGFYLTPEGTSIRYYDGTQAAVAGTTARFSVTTTVASSLAWPNDWARRSVAVTVKYLPSGATAYSTNTILVRGGV